MAPLAFGDKINLYAMVGTWLGTLFTLFGLVAVITQLRSLLNDFANSRDEIIKAAAGDWAICLPKLRPSDSGVIEGKAPSLRAWIHYHYNEGKSISVLPFEKKSSSGQSSWSQLFCRLQIFPEDLTNPGHRDSLDERIIPPLQFPTTADILVDGSKISYGLPSGDFAAILILSGFSPSDCDPKETRKSTSHMGYMYLATHGDPFSHIAQLDAGSWNNFNTFHGTKWEGRYADRLNVRHCLDLAVGLLRFDFAGKPRTFFFSMDDADTLESKPNQPPWPRPSLQQMQETRRNITELTGGSIQQNPIYDVTSMSFPDFREHFGREDHAAWRGLPYDNCLSTHHVNGAFELAFGLNALKPWGLPAVIPKSVVNTFCPHLRKAFVSDPGIPSSAITLIRKFRELPTTVQYNVPHRTRDAMDAALDSLRDVETRNFSCLSARCSLYYDAMNYVFENHNLKLADVEIELAAHCATKLAASEVLSQFKLKDKEGRMISPGMFLDKGFDEFLDFGIEAEDVPHRYPYLDPWVLFHIEHKNKTMVGWEAQFKGFMRECLKGSPINEVEPWACEILATYIHAWLQEAHDIKWDFRENFRRRVFLG